MRTALLLGVLVAVGCREASVPGASQGLLAENTSRQASSNDASPANKRPLLSEREKIERLIRAVAQQPDAVFVRNSREHSAADAAAHLRRKWEAAGDRVTTAAAFIEQVASRSSLSGVAYSIRFSDGSEMTSAEFLRDELRKLESTSEE